MIIKKKWQTWDLDNQKIQSKPNRNKMVEPNKKLSTIRKTRLAELNLTHKSLLPKFNYMSAQPKNNLNE